MADARIAPSSPRTVGGQVRDALDSLEGLVVDGLKHGFFDYSIACEVGNGGKRHLVIRAGIRATSSQFPPTKCRADGGLDW